MPAYEPLLKKLNHITSRMWYTPALQASVSFSNYWRDPMRLHLYREHSAFLADINNEREVKNASYVRRIARLEHFVLLYSTGDQIIQPALSSWFGYFKDNSTHELIPLSQTPLYRKDWIGLRSLDRMGRLHFAACSCQHIKVPTATCKVEAFDRSTRDFLKPEMGGTALLRWLPFVPSRPRPPFGRTPYQKIAAELEETLDKVRTLETEVAKARERAAVAERGLRRVQGKETRPVAAAAWRAAIRRTEV